jgi:hypothetical protein
VTPVGWAWCSRGVWLCVLLPGVLLPHLSPVVIDRVDGKVVIAAHPVLSPAQDLFKGSWCEDGPHTELVAVRSARATQVGVGRQSHSA